jgi:methanogenic corrinoid protein MtbC1
MLVVMTTKSDFTDEEWTRVRRAPLVAGMAVSLADPGGPIELAKETTASLKSATNPPSREQLLADIALDIQSMGQQKQNPLTEFRPTQGSDPRQQILEELRAVSEIVSSKAAADETAAFKQWLLTSAQAAADAAKEGGFMGFGAEQVSQGEKDMLSQVRTAIGA